MRQFGILFDDPERHHHSDHPAHALCFSHRVPAGSWTGVISVQPVPGISAQLLFRLLHWAVRFLHRVDLGNQHHKGDHRHNAVRSAHSAAVFPGRGPKNSDVAPLPGNLLHTVDSGREAKPGLGDSASHAGYSVILGRCVVCAYPSVLQSGDQSPADQWRLGMHSFKDYLRLYFIIETQYIKARMQYRADFIISSIGMFFSSLATLGIFWVIFNSIPNLAGWSFMQLVFIYGFYMIAISPMQILFDHIWQIRFHVQQGTFLKYYFRPLNMMFYYMSEMFDLKGLTQLFVGIALLIYASIRLDLSWTLSRVALLLVTLFSASLVQIAITVLAGCAAFWVLDSYPVLGLAWKLREFSPYPMSIFDGAFRVAFTYIIPIGFVAFYPSQLFLRPNEVSPLVYFSPIVGLGLFALTYWIWTKGVNTYTGTGS